MELRARGTILQALDNEAKDADKGTQANSEDGGDTLLSPKQASNARDTRSLSARWWDESRPRKRGAIRPAPKSSCDNFFALLTDWLKARGLEDALEHKEDKDGFVVYRYTRVPLTSEQEGWETAFHGTRWYALWLILASGVLLESDDREAGHDFWEPGVYCSPLIPTARWYARPHIVFGDGVYHRALLEVVVDTKRRKRERMRGGVQWVFPREAVAIRAVWLEKNAPPNVEEQRFTTWDPGLEAVPPGLSAPKPVTNEVAGLSREEADPEESNEVESNEAVLGSEPPHKESGATQPEAGMQDEEPPRAEQQRPRQGGLTTYSRLKIKVPSNDAGIAGAGRQPMQPSPTRTQPSLAQPTESQGAIVRPPQIVRLQQGAKERPHLRVTVPPPPPPPPPQGGMARPMGTPPRVPAARKETVAGTPVAPCATTTFGGILAKTGIASKAPPPAPLQSSKPVFASGQPHSAAKARKRPVDAFSAACDGFEQDLHSFMGELGVEEAGLPGDSSEKRQKTWREDLLDDIERKKKELLSKKT